ncbi:CPBP family intramembrane glutamic endopeptidase [Methyloglobulus sp.]|uniref:CPBP family intramembrane glutamic endopeptidase n=1 Tax=Methyloglobulus sp. TaxID=2518622 RepID=UPI0032B70A43
MNNSPFNPERFFKSACLFEAALILVAIVLGWMSGINPFADLHYSESAILYGILGTIPLFLLFLLLEQFTSESVITIRRFLMETLGPALHRHHWADLFVLAAIAGISEEVLFRGVIQPWMESSWGTIAGLIGSNILFGMVHAITPLYFVMATVVGIYLGLALDIGGDRNLLTPVIIHSLYDFLAFLALMRSYRANLVKSQ